jgi:plasmid stabilization system protein ParE
MAGQKGLSGKEALVLGYLLKARNYRAGRVELVPSEVIGELRLAIPELLGGLRSLQASGLIRLCSLPQDLEASYVAQVFDDVDGLDLRYIEKNTAESEYVSSRRAIAEQLKVFPHYAEPFSPLEAARLFHELRMTLERILNESSQLSQPREALERELLAIREELLPFRRFIFSRISEFSSQKEKRPDLPTEKRMRMLLLLSQVGMSRLATAEDVAQDLLENLEILKARHLVGEISPLELEDKEKTLWKEISKRMPPELPNQDALAAWAQRLTAKFESLGSLRQRGVISDDFFQSVSQDLHEDIALLKSHAPHAS